MVVFTALKVNNGHAQMETIDMYQQFQFWYERLRYIVKMIPAMLSQLIYDTETIYEAK